jgi:hypothetical protein
LKQSSEGSVFLSNLMSEKFIAKLKSRIVLKRINKSSAPVLLISIALVASPHLGHAADSAGIEFFEKNIRPILVENCYKCHSKDAEKLKGNLLLDTREGVLKGGDTGPAIVPGQPDKSLLIQAVRYTNSDLQMPPKNKKLSTEQIADLEHWVKIGAPDPRAAAPTVAKTNPKDHWAFKPVQHPALPRVGNPRWVQSPIDSFILARLDEKKLSPNPAADKRTLIIRASFDLIGLPPTEAEVKQFLADTSPEASGRLVDRLLNSPHYGERWGRYWLDIARYADTKGYVFEEERRYPYSYTYRDYVIRALNDDLPYDQFVIQQIAADLLPLGEDKRPLAALGFLTLGRRFLNNQPDIIDDRIDVVTRGTMGLTVACARCHDHKFDPIPTRDYYSLYGVFASCNEPADKPLLGKEAMPAAYNEYLAERKKREQELKDFRASKETELRAKLRQQVSDYMLAIYDAARISDGDKQEGLARERKLDPGLMREWRRYLEDRRKAGDGIFVPWFAYASIKGTNFAEQAKGLEPIEDKTNPLVAKVFSTFGPKSMKEVAQRYASVFKSVDEKWKALREKDKTVAKLGDSSEEAVRQLLYGSDSPTQVDPGEFRRLFDTPTSQKIRALRRKIDELDATHPGAPPRAMALQDNATPRNAQVFKRGNPANPGEEVPRQFLQLVAGENRQPFKQGSGRLELAKAIVDPKNPLTARVLVNRVWLYHFGAPLVRTPSDFGVRSDAPANPELLDYLASRFVDEGWSLKKLHRLIMVSSTYQQSSADNPKAAKVDPNNQFYWRMNRRRLDFESMRDTFLALSGKIDPTIGGRPVDITTEPFTARRTVYGFVERQNLPGLFRTFDFASPDTTSPQRFSTTVPQQALFLMNSPFVVQQASALLQRPEVKACATDEQRVQELYRLVFHRQPDPDEFNLARSFVQAKAKTASAPPLVWQYGFGAYDEKSKRVKSFDALPTFTKYSWQGSTNLPDPKLGWVLLSAEGGHPGNDAQHAAIRRWRAPADGVISISSELEHPNNQGDGVRARVVSSRKGLLGEWIAYNSKTNTPLAKIEVKRGDLIDFVTDCRGSVEFDSFTWAPVLKYVTGTAPKDEPREWNAKTDFAGPVKPKPPPIDNWTKYAQVLLLANELMFVD